MRWSKSMLVLVGAALAACAPQDEARMNSSSEGRNERALGPVDGFDLPPTDLDRVQVGDLAPDFTLVSLEGPPVTLSSYRGEKNVVLVFYRGHW